LIKFRWIEINFRKWKIKSRREIGDYTVIFWMFEVSFESFTLKQSIYEKCYFSRWIHRFVFRARWIVGEDAEQRPVLGLAETVFWA
jgi:hypothetical protein